LTKRFDLLSDALGMRRGAILALVGAGGKTRVLLTVSEELAARGWRVLASTTTKVGRSVSSSMPVLQMQAGSVPDELTETFRESGRAFLCGGRDTDGKLLGVDPSVPAKLRDSGVVDAVVVEADGSRQMPLKAPGEHEPVIPNGVDIVCPVAGLDALGLPVSEGSVHRPELVRALAGAGPVTPHGLAAVLCADAGGLKGVPAGADVRPVLNKLDMTKEERAIAAAQAVLEARPDRVRSVLVTSVLHGDYLLIEP
jgi:probable selenium-dependent hydroxylase accessory protein YqeC